MLIETCISNLIEMAKKNDEIVVLDAELAQSTGTYKFQEKFADRFINVGIAEQNLIGVAAGLAIAGMKPYVTGFAVFSILRAYEQIRQLISFNNLDIKILVTHSGLRASHDGASHQCFEDIALMSVLPNFTIISPASSGEIVEGLQYLQTIKGPGIMRICDENYEADFNVFFSEHQNLTSSKIFEGEKDICMVTTGTILREVIKAKDSLNIMNIYPSILYISVLKPLNRKEILNILKEYKRIYVIEEHSIIGGLGSLICEMCQFCSETPPIKRIGINDMFGQSGDYEKLLDYYGLSAGKIENYVLADIK
ncbi:transketolase family protein [Blautia pseudococcoides]|nr:transketolase family protein [Blautia pseudococcoides]